MRRRGRSLEDDRARRTTGTGSQTHRLCAARDGGRIIVTELSMLCLPVVAEMSRARWPSSPTARSCGCLHRGSNAQAVSKTGKAARSRVPMASASCIARGGRRASRRAHSWGRRGSGRRACTCSMCTGLSRARAQRQGRPKAARAACVAACRAGGTPAGGGLVSLDSKRLVTKLIAGWIVLPVL